MAVITLSGAKPKQKQLGADNCKCVMNTRTKRSALLCFVGKSKKSRSGWQFQKGGSQRCNR